MKLDARMQQHMGGLTFEDLPKPFVCVAAEIRTGHEIWLSSGSLITAMRASYALPGVFEPVTCNGRVLVDGALVNPVPVSVCRAYEQPLVVAVNLHYDLFGRAAVIKHSAGELVVERRAKARRELVTSERQSRLGITGVMVEAFNIIQDRISRARLAGDPPDLSLQPKLGHIGLSEFPPRRRSDPPRLRGDEGADGRTRPPADRARLKTLARAASMTRNCTVRLPFQ